MRRLVLPPRFELGFAASETAALSIELRERNERQLPQLGAFVNVQKRKDKLQAALLHTLIRLNRYLP